MRLNCFSRSRSVSRSVVGRPCGQLLRALDQLAAGEQRLDLGGRQRVAGFDRGLAGHHVEHLVQQFFLVQVQQFLFAVLQQLAHELGRVELFEERRERLHRHRVRPERRDLDPEPYEQRLDLLEQRHLPRLSGHRDRDQQPLRFERPARDARDQLLVHDPLVQRVLIDDDQSILGSARRGSCCGAGSPERASPTAATGRGFPLPYPGEGWGEGAFGRAERCVRPRHCTLGIRHGERSPEASESASKALCRSPSPRVERGVSRE